MERHHCLSQEQLNRYFEKRLGVGARERAEEHLSRCPACRRRLTEAYEEGVPLPEVQASAALKARVMELPLKTVPKRRRWLALAAATVVALGLGVLLAPTLKDPEPRDPETLRAPPQGAAQALELELLTPASGLVLTAEPPIFAWREVPGARRYTLRLVDGLGNVMYQETTSATSLRPSLEELLRGQEVFWYVTAVLEDGTTLSSAVWSLKRG